MDLLKHVFQHVPHNYVDHLLFHMAGVILSPGATPGSRALAIQIDRAINTMKHWLAQVRQDALQLVQMPTKQMAETAALEILGQMELHTRYAYAGWTYPNTGTLQEGAVWIADNIQRLAPMNVTPYSSGK